MVSSPFQGNILVGRSVPERAQIRDRLFQSAERTKRNQVSDVPMTFRQQGS